MSVYSPTGSASRSTGGSGASGAVTNPVITNTTLTLANTEYSISLPSNTIRFMLRARNSSRLQLSYVSGESNTEYITLLPGVIYIEKEVSTSVSLTLYIQSNTAGEVVELVSWT